MSKRVVYFYKLLPYTLSLQGPNNHKYITTKKEIVVLRVIFNTPEKMLSFYLFCTRAFLLPSLSSAPLLLSLICRTLWLEELGFSPSMGLQ